MKLSHNSFEPRVQQLKHFSGPEALQNHFGPRSRAPQHLLCLVGSSLLRRTTGLLVWLVSCLASQKGHRYCLSRTKAMDNFLISAGKRGCCLSALPQQGRMLPPFAVRWRRLAPDIGHDHMPELTGACFRVLIPHSMDQGLVSHSACACFIGLSLYFIL